MHVSTISHHNAFVATNNVRQEPIDVEDKKLLREFVKQNSRPKLRKWDTKTSISQEVVLS